MATLSATYDVPMPQWCFIEIATSENFKLDIEKDGYKMSLEFKLSYWGSNIEFRDKKSTRGIERVSIKVSKDFSEIPNLLDSLVLLEQNFNYSAIAISVLNSFVHYFRFTLYTPLLRDFSYADGQFAQAIWKDGNDKFINLNFFSAVMPIRSGEHGNLSATRLGLEKLEDLRIRLIDPIKNTVVEQLLADAQNAWFNRNYFSAVLEMAIACEQAINYNFTQQDARNGQPGNDIPVVHLLDKAAIKACGKSYKKEHPQEYNSIDFLFRCRNSVAHRATLTFKTDQGDEITPDRNQIAGWWYSSFNLIKWLDSI
jgi:hypothetical protein